MSLFEIREHEISVAEVVAAVTRPEAGGISVFIGTVRNDNAGRAVTRLEYQAYASMAAKEMARIGAEIGAEIAGVELAVLHRTGSLAVGDIAVACAASAPHRGEAFDACRLLIDRIKARVPIWKREHGPSGPYWVGWEDARCSPDGDHSAHRHSGEQEQ
jgi:molybdopterin synthase catalytic subunit